MASARQRRRPHRVRWILGGGAVLLAAGLGLLIVDAHARLDASEESITFTAEERELLGPGADEIRDSLRRWSLVESLIMSSDVGGFSVEIRESAAGNRDVSVLQDAQAVLVPVRGSWHFAPVTMLAFAGITVMVGGLFIGAVRWRRP